MVLTSTQGTTTCSVRSTCCQSSILAKWTPFNTPLLSAWQHGLSLLITYNTKMRSLLCSRSLSKPIEDRQRLLVKDEITGDISMENMGCPLPRWGLLFQLKYSKVNSDFKKWALLLGEAQFSPGQTEWDPLKCGKHHFDVRYRRKLLYLLTVTQKLDSAACSCNVHFSLYCDFTICVWWCCNRKRISHVCNVLELYQRIDVIYYYKNNSVFCKFIRAYNRNKQTWS